MRKLILYIGLLLSMLCFSLSAFASLVVIPIELTTKNDINIVAAPIRAASGVVNADNVNLRNGPGAHYICLGQLPKDITVEIISEQSSPTWYYIKFLDISFEEKSGYISAQYVTITTAYTDSHIINSNNVNLRSGPGIYYVSLGQVSKGTSINVIIEQSSPTWYFIEILSGTHTGTRGYVNAPYVDTLSSDYIIDIF